MIAYIETNFIMASATGQDADTLALLAIDPAKLRICIPTVCVMEAWHALNAKLKEFNVFRSELSRRIREVQRDRTSPHAAQLLPDMVRSEIQAGVLFNDIERRFREVLQQLPARAELLPLSPDVLKRSLALPHIDAPADNLILHVICEHAATHPGEEKVLLTANKNDFWTEFTRRVLGAHGITEFRTHAAHILQMVK
ncbi:MAG: hypothetical protein JWL69_529 [Phycisphaerales bacterium]|nr:hypothetical protein [Phycisphaerales bacterium]MDB5355486.1 hypothetical protein [Phycisphaerales bacterium]